MIAGWSLAENVSPTRSLIADFEGTLNATIFSCDVFSQAGSLQITTRWSIENFRGVDSLRFVTDSLAPELFLITGDTRPDDPTLSFQNYLTVLNLTSELDGVVIYCGSGRDPVQVNFTLRIYRK